MPHWNVTTDFMFTKHICCSCLLILAMSNTYITIHHPLNLLNCEPWSCRQKLLLLHLLNGLFSRKTGVSWHQTGKLLWILLEQEMMGWQWHQLNHMQIICISLQTENHTTTSPFRCLHSGCPSCCPTNSVKALKAYMHHADKKMKQIPWLRYVNVSSLIRVAGDVAAFNMYWNLQHRNVCFIITTAVTVLPATATVNETRLPISSSLCAY